MKKGLIIGLAMALVLGLATAGIGAPNINVDMDVGAGWVDITTNGFDHSTWHPGSTGETNTFEALGGFHGNYNASEGYYGSLGSYINVDSYPGGADLVFTDYQNFNVLSGNHIYNVEGYFNAHASGGDDQVKMNLKSIGSMYVWSEATNPWSADCLRGGLIEKEVWTTINGTLNTDLYLAVTTTGTATMSNSNIWGWTNGETGTSSTNYSGGTRNVSATGSGMLVQAGFGTNILNYSNSYSMPGGGTTGTDGFGNPAWFFNSGIIGTYSMDAS